MYLLPITFEMSYSLYPSQHSWLFFFSVKRCTSYFQASLSNTIPEASEVEIKSGEYFANDTFDVRIYVI